MRWWASVVVAVCTAVPGGPARAEDAPPGSPVTFTSGKSTLKLAPLALPGLERRDETDDQLFAWWSGRVQASVVYVELRVYPHAEYEMREPDAVIEFVRHGLRQPDREGDPAFTFTKEEMIAGDYGWVPAATLATGPLPSPSKVEGEVMVLGGVLDAHAYSVRVFAKPPLAASDRAKALAFLRDDVRAEGPRQDPAWTDAEARERWKKEAPTKKIQDNLKDLVRTKHYILFTDSSAGPLFAKKMESCYEQIQKVFPFPEMPWRRLMPVFLFKDFSGYEAFGRAKGMESVSNTKGHAWKDYYATYYDSPNDPVHIHEATHQIFENRLHLDGGGSWFQEAVAEYMCTTPNQRRSFGRQAGKSGRFCPFRTLVANANLIDGAAPLDGYEAYTQAASIVEYLREGFKDPALFQRFVHEVGSLPRENVAATDAKMKEIYGLDLDGLQAGWLKYWASK